MSEQAADRLRILFYGRLLEGADRQQAEAFLARRFKLDDAKLAQVMSGRKVALRSNMDQAQAFSLQAQLEAAGLETRIEVMPVKAAAPQPARFNLPEDHAATMRPTAPADVDAQSTARVQTKAANFTAPEPTPARTRQPADSGAHCPACGQAVTDQAITCRWCGKRLQPGSRLWLWLLVVPGALAMLLIPVALVLSPPSLPGLNALDMAQAQMSPEQHVAQGILEAEQTQLRIQDFVLRTNFWPNSNLDAGLPEPEGLASASLERIVIGNNALITIRFRQTLPEIGGHTLAFVPERTADGLPRWRCRGGTLPEAWRPASCQAPSTQAPTQTPTQGTAPPPAATPAVDGQDLPPAAFVRRVLDDDIQNTRWLRDRALAYWRDHGRWPDSHEALQLEDPYRLGSQAMQQVRLLSNGEVLYEFSGAIPQLRGDQLTLVPTPQPGQWACQSSLPDTHLPESCWSGLR